MFFLARFLCAHLTRPPHSAKEETMEREKKSRYKKVMTTAVAGRNKHKLLNMIYNQKTDLIEWFLWRSIPSPTKERDGEPEKSSHIEFVVNGTAEIETKKLKKRECCKKYVLIHRVGEREPREREHIFRYELLIIASWSKCVLSLKWTFRRMHSLLLYFGFVRKCTVSIFILFNGKKVRGLYTIRRKIKRK